MAFYSSKKDEKKKEEPRPVVTTPVLPEEKPSPSYIGKTMNIEADISSDDDVIIEGTVTGNIDVGKILTIGKHGSVKADIKAGIVRIYGEAKGNIHASDKVEILAQGRYTGNIYSEKLVVAEGAILNGNIN